MLKRTILPFLFIVMIYSCSENSITDSNSTISIQPWIAAANLHPDTSRIKSRIIINSTIIAQDNSIIAGTEGYGIFRSTNSGLSWENVNDEFLYVTSFSKNSKGQLFAGLWSYLLKSDDNGKTWIRISNDIGFPHFQSIFIASNDYIFAGALSGLFVSKDNGNSWTENPSLPFVISDMVEDKNKNLYVSIMAYGGGLRKSSDNGNTWGEVNEGIKPNQNIVKSICLTNNDEILIGTWGWGLYKSKLDTIVWKEELKNIKLVHDLKNVNGTVFAATDSLGVIFKNKNSTWIENNENLENINVRCISFSDDMIFIGTTTGIYYRPY